MNQTFQEQHAAGLARIAAGTDILAARANVDGEVLTPGGRGDGDIARHAHAGFSCVGKGRVLRDAGRRIRRVAGLAVTQPENAMMKRSLRQAVLARIAASHEVDPECVRVGDKGAVFYRDGDDLRCLCQHGSDYWSEIEAEIIAAQAIELAARH